VRCLRPRRVPASRTFLNSQGFRACDDPNLRGGLRTSRVSPCVRRP
jgi:hypothetical protein